MPFYAKKRGVDLTFFAKSYESGDWSVIPLVGGDDPSRAKLPAIKWGRYQHVRASASDFEEWFLERGFGGLGIVCGRVSNLVVLDFDDPAKVSEFRHLYPHLTQTYTVESGLRHLPHFYYRVPQGLQVYSRSAPGVDLRADGTYVVAPPTMVGDAEWRVVQEQPLYELSADDLRAIWRFIASVVPTSTQNGLKPPSRSILGVSVSHSWNAVGGVSPKCRNSDTSIIDLVSEYRARLSGGRNNALFEVACFARDHGWQQEAVQSALANLHALQPDCKGRCESFQQRYAEAIRTIASAFSRPPRPSVVQSDGASVGIPTLRMNTATVKLPNTVREWLLGNGLTAAARVLDGLALVGLSAGMQFTERQACELLHPYRIGRRSVTAALKSILPDGLPLFAHYPNPLQTTPAEANAVIPTKQTVKKCDLNQGAKRVKISGRPAAHYQMPNTESIAERLGLRQSGGDTIAATDLATPAAYRRALHRELIKRRPGQYPRRWLAARLGVSVWSSRRYDAQLNITVLPMYAEHPLRWTNVESLLPLTLDDSSPGTFLEDNNGKRYPPLRSIAFKLLDEGHRIVFKRRVANSYHYPDGGSVGIPTLGSSAGYRTAAGPTLIAAGDRGKSPHDSCSHSPTPQWKSPQPGDPPTDQSPLAKGAGIPAPLHLRPKTPIPTDKTPPSFWYCTNCLKTYIGSLRPTTCTRCNSDHWQTVPDFIWRNQERLKQWWQTQWRALHPAAPRRATPLAPPAKCRNSDTSDTTTDAAHHAHRQIRGLSLSNARRLVERYGETQVDKAVRRVVARTGVIRPAGLLVTLLRSEQTFYSKRPVRKPPQHAPEDAETWVRRMADSRYVDFLANADDFKQVIRE